MVLILWKTLSSRPGSKEAVILSIFGETELVRNATKEKVGMEREGMGRMSTVRGGSDGEEAEGGKEKQTGK